MPEINQFSNEFISIGYCQCVRNQEISYYLLSAKLIISNHDNFSIRECVEILKSGLKVALTMKLINFEDLDYDLIIEGHKCK